MKEKVISRTNLEMMQIEVRLENGKKKLDLTPSEKKQCKKCKNNRYTSMKRGRREQRV